MKRLTVAVFAIIAAALAFAQTIPNTMTQGAGAGETNWALWGLGILAIAFAVGFLYLLRRNPTEAAKIEAAGIAGAGKVAEGIESIVARLEAHFKAAPAAPAPAAADAAPAPVVVAGKAGQAGTFKLEVPVTGDHKDDMPKIVAAAYAAYQA